ncbi:efflux RND transporter periplasmic adaptor subunit [Luteibacter yeojuensis]|uniref:Efflux RND transporter periplasmic adaptor subunit n=1 Tax=Luteibacter yeojuensis TaxID=345309 RepID=A0A7X5TPP4_9GAMM|nr:efflux RND transporter periplasmic adaptor subunit [Luteibacter yeojuensis]NID14672.1 efflux RND transporter periplasmic adaptor subunit [Luteibacter yeojuensis]
MIHAHRHRIPMAASGAAFVLLLGACSHAGAPAAAQVPSVDVAEVVNRQVAERQVYSGRLQAVDRVDIRAQVPGKITKVYFRDGQRVKKGDPLFLIDPRPYQAAADRAAAQLAAARARATFASADYVRAQKLLAGNAISRRDFDDRFNASLSATADVKAAEAALEQAKVDLGYTTIDAPVDGKVSRAERTVGNIVAAGYSSPSLTTLVSISPIYADFDVDERTYLQFLDTAGQREVEVRLGLANETGVTRLGKIASVDNQLENTTGTIRVRASFENTDGALVPGLFARVSVGAAPPHPAVLVDDRAISTDQAKKYVLVVDGNKTAQYREVFLGSLVDGLRVISSGLKPGERIIVDGIQRVHPGEQVQVKVVPMAGENDPVATR